MQTPKRLTISMTLEEFTALRAIADDEMRDPRDHARYILRNELIRRGKMPSVPKNEAEKALEDQWQAA